jgi:hypothetical protein
MLIEKVNFNSFFLFFFIRFNTQLSNHLGCSAAVLALKYGHIECANQITHRDWDEFFVVPRPLSIYETPSTTDDNQTTSTKSATISKKKSKISPNNFSQIKTEPRRSTLSFGLLKIIFNDSDIGYSTRLAGLCKKDKQIRHHQHLKHKKQEAPQISTMTINKFDRTKSTIVNGTHSCSSTEALVNETQLSNITKQCQTNVDNNGNLNNSNRTSPRVQLLMQQHLTNKSNSKENNNNNNNSSFIQKTTSKTQLSIDDINKTRTSSFKNDHNEEIKSKTSTPSIYRQTSNSTINHSEKNMPIQRPKTSVIRNQTITDPSPSRLRSAKIKPTHIPSGSTKNKPLLINRIESSSNLPKQPQSIVGSVSSTYSQAIYAGRSISAVMNHSIPRSNNSSCSIHEAKGTATRYNKPEELFGFRPEELFAPPEQHQPKILDPRLTKKPNENTRLKRNQFQKEQHIWQQDVDQIIELYNIHYSPNYRKSAIQRSTQGVTQTDTINDLPQGGRARRMSITKTSSTNLKQPPTNPKQSTFALLNIPRRNSITRPSIKLTST